jgi:predicted nucleic acid-binding protein
MRYVVDTNIWIAIFRKDPKVLPRLLGTLRQGQGAFMSSGTGPS